MTNIIATAQATNTGEHYSTSLSMHGHELIADEPEEAGGKGLGPAPGDYACAALASCTAITLRMYAERKGWKLDAIHVKVTLVRGTDMPTGINTFYCEVKVDGNLEGDQEKRLMEIAKACPIHRLLTKPSDVVTVM